MDMERMERVMKRVRGENDRRPGETDDLSVLAGLIAGENESRMAYERMRTQCSGPCRVLLTQLWNDENRHFKTLQGEYFALTGNSLAVRPSRFMGSPGLLSALRQAREKELAAAEAYRRAASQTRKANLRNIYEKHAAEEEDHAARLLKMIQRAMR